MSRFSDKVFRGELPTPDDWAEHLIEAHEREPRMSPEAFEPYRTRDGLTSYELLARALPEDSAGRDLGVVDLACGDGHLAPLLLRRLGPGARVIGVDMSEAGLRIARERHRDPRLSWMLARAQALPLPDASVDVVLCHMSFMLMAPVDPVASEILRVLRPGGRFAAVTGNPQGRRGFYAELFQAMVGFILHRYPKMAQAPTGDPRASSPEGLRELFGHDPRVERVEDPLDFWLEVRTSPAGVWEFVKNMYLPGMLKPEEKDELRRELLARAEAVQDASGQVLLEFPMRRLGVRVRG